MTDKNKFICIYLLMLISPLFYTLIFADQESAKCSPPCKEGYICINGNCYKDNNAPELPPSNSELDDINPYGKRTYKYITIGYIFLGVGSVISLITATENMDLKRTIIFGSVGAGFLASSSVFLTIGYKRRKKANEWMEEEKNKYRNKYSISIGLQYEKDF